MWKLTGLQFQGSPSFSSCVTMGRLPTLSELGAFTCKVQMHLLCKAVLRGEDFLWSADTVVSCPEASDGFAASASPPHLQWVFVTPVTLFR